MFVGTTEVTNNILYFLFFTVEKSLGLLQAEATKPMMTD